jgi:hypothetical protein
VSTLVKPRKIWWKMFYGDKSVLKHPCFRRDSNPQPRLLLDWELRVNGMDGAGSNTLKHDAHLNSLILKLKLFHYVPWRRLGGEDV